MEVITGQSSLGIEIQNQMKQLGVTTDVIVLGVGGGGCCCGVTTSSKMMLPDVEVFGVEPENADKLNMSFKLDRHFIFSKVDTFADGTAMKGVGVNNLPLMKALINPEVTVVPKNKLC
mmetsp:Transcript_112971/g.243359  ORF Transcript_112971/g.243359 Transcript_112971/m.243359 type:complete len:118 (-) Transcript_112971:515-868(-)